MSGVERRSRSHAEPAPEMSVRRRSPEPSKTKRLFVALWPTQRTRERLRTACADVIETAGGRHVPPENLHVTLTFLGSWPVAGEATLRDALADVRGDAFRLRFDRLVVWRKPRVLCLAASETPPALASLVAALETQLESLGWRRSDRLYRPHVTLARKIARQPAAGLEQPIEWPAARFSLVQSETAQEGARYRRLESWPLAREADAGADRGEE